MGGFPHSSVGKESACNAGDPGLIPGSGRSPGEGNVNPLQYSCLENPIKRGAWQATVHGIARVKTWLRDYTTPPHSMGEVNKTNTYLNFILNHFPWPIPLSTSTPRPRTIYARIHQISNTPQKSPKLSKCTQREYIKDDPLKCKKKILQFCIFNLKMFLFNKRVFSNISFLLAFIELWHTTAYMYPHFLFLNLLVERLPSRLKSIPLWGVDICQCQIVQFIVYQLHLKVTIMDIITDLR